jgi:hypothetical protein
MRILGPTRLWLAALGVMLLCGTGVAARGAKDALARAAGRGDAAQVRALVEGGADVDARDALARTALVHAAGSGSLETVEALLQARADVDAADRDGLTALIEATRLGHEAIVRALLDAGADPDMLHRAYGTALDLAERDGRQGIADLLRSHGSRGSGHSTGDTVCVRPWDGQGYCAKVLAIEGVRFHLQITRLIGCERGCAAHDCSARRRVGGSSAGLTVGARLWVENACLTDTGLAGAAEVPR